MFLFIIYILFICSSLTCLDSELVLMEFGTGAVKVTPAHDHNDYLCGKRHKLEFINILNEEGTLNANAGPFKAFVFITYLICLGYEKI